MMMEASEEEQRQEEQEDASESSEDNDDYVRAMESLEEGSYEVTESQRASDLSRREEAAVRWGKLLVLAIMIFSALAGAHGVYFYLKLSDQQEFENQFHRDATKVLGVMGTRLDRTLGAVDSFAFDIVSHARAAGDKWPFVTIPNFAMRASKTLVLSDAFLITMHPIVSWEQQPEWQNYSSLVNHGFALGENNEFLPDSYDLVDHTASGNNSSSLQQYLLPLSQTSSKLPIQRPHSCKAPLTAIKDQKVLISNAYTLQDASDVNEASKSRPSKTPNCDMTRQPVSDIYFPIVDPLGDEENAVEDAVSSLSSSSSSSSHKVVGIMAVSFFWKDMILGILSTANGGIVVVFENACNVTVSYKINGPKVSLLGHGDLHDPDYTDFNQTSSLLQLGNKSLIGTRYTGALPLAEEPCPFRVRIYASSEMRDTYMSSKPVTFTLACVLIFVFTSAGFIIYDCCVERRQRTMVYTAMQSNTNVSVLEKKVQERTRRLEESNQRLEEANRQVTQASAAQLQHFACMSHELRTPLNGIIGCSSLLSTSDLNPMQRESIDMIVSSGDLLLNIVNDVLDYAKLESGNVDVEIKKTGLQEAIGSVVWSMQKKALAKNVALQVFFDVNLPEFIDTDIRRLQQILYNVVGNATKFSKAGGKVEFRASVCSGPPSDMETALPSSQTDVEAAPPTGSSKNLRFIVKDYGKGIARSDFEKIFKPFRQDSAETELVYGGTGLGLAISSKLVRRLGGTISVDSELGEWTEFTIDLPFAENSPTDFEQASRGLRESTVFLVCEDLQTEETALRVLRQCPTVDVDTSRSMEELQEKAAALVENASKKNRLPVLLVDEELFDRRSYESFSDAAGTSPIVVSFGPNFCVKESKEHFRSLEQVLPCVLAKRIATAMTTTLNDRQASLKSRAVKQATSLDEQSGHSTSVPYDKLKVLIAEDNVVNQKVLKRILNRLGIQDVVVVGNGKKAVDREAVEAFDVVLMDMQMPVMDGIEACSCINTRKHGSHPRAKVVFLTAHAMDTYEARCFEVGGVDFLTKPCKISNLDKCFQKLHLGEDMEATSCHGDV